MEKESLEAEIQIKEKQLEEQKKERHWKTAVSGAAMGAFLLTGLLTMAFEASGNISPRAMGDILRDFKKFIVK